MANGTKVQCVGKDAIGKFQAVQGCGNIFVFEADKINKTVLDEESGTAKYDITCPACNTIYTIGYESDLMLIRKQELRSIDSPAARGNLKKRIEKLRKLIADEQHSLREKYGN